MSASFSEEVCKLIIDRLCVVFGKAPGEIRPETNLETDLGAKSVNISQLANFIEDEYEAQVSFVELRKRKTVAEIVKYVEEICEY